MKTIITTWIFLCIGLSILAQKTATAQQVDLHNHDQKNISFVKNQHQWEAPISYKASIGGLNTLFLGQQAFTYLFANADDAESLHETFNGVGPERPIRLHAYRVKFKNANDVDFVAQDKQTQYNNYFIGNDPRKWAEKVPILNTIIYDDLYDGIDLKAYSEGGHFKYDFIVKPGAKPESIQQEYEGTDGLRIAQGKLIIETSVETIIESLPYVYQLINGEKVSVECEYQLDGQTVSYYFPNGYDPTNTLIIDPVVVAATLSGMTGAYNFGHAATFDNQGNIYASGRTFGAGYPVTMGAYQENYGGGNTDIAVTKYNPEGTSQIYATYLGGSAAEVPHSMIVDFNGQLFIFGTSSSEDYPVTSNAFQTEKSGGIGGIDIVITKLNAEGTALLGSTFVGGSETDGENFSALNANYGDSYKGEIVLDNQGNPYVASCTGSDDFPVTANAYDTTLEPSGSLIMDAVVFKMNNDLSDMIWATYLGGQDADTAFGLRVDDFGKTYVTGIAGNADFPTTPGTVQPNWPGGGESAYVAVLNATGTELIASTFWGSGGDEHSFFLDLDEDGHVHIFGQTTGEMPITPDTYFYDEGSRQFISAFSEDLSELVYSTVIGNGVLSFGYDFVPVAFMVDKCNNIYFSGYYAIAGLPLTSDAISTVGGTIYLGVLNPLASSLQFGTYYGNADHVDGGTSHYDKSGIIYQAVCSCATSGILNTLPGAFAETQTTFCDIGVFKIDFEINTVTAAAQVMPGTSGLAPFEVNFSFTGKNATEFLWDFNDGSATTSEMNPTHIFEEIGIYEVMLVARNETTCNMVDTSYLIIEVPDVVAVENLENTAALWLSPGLISIGQSTRLYVKGEYQGMLHYSVFDLQGREFAGGTFLKNEKEVSQMLNTPQISGVYIVQVSDGTGEVQHTLRLLVL
ncbi:MAG: PKD repeat protein [Saprospiraceae bacterium]|jgi:PKD repeat protein